MNKRCDMRKKLVRVLWGSVFLGYFPLAGADFDNALPPSYSDGEKESVSPLPMSPATAPSFEKKEPLPANENEGRPAQKKTSLGEARRESEEDFQHNAQAPVYFSGESGDVSRKTGVLNLIGNVLIVQDDTQLTADKAQIIGAAGSLPSSGSQKVQRAIAKGNVKILKKSFQKGTQLRTSSDEVEFLVPERIVILRGKARVWRGQEFVNADVITVNLNTGVVDLQDPQGLLDPRSALHSGASGGS